MDDRFSKHDIFESNMMKIIRCHATDNHVPDIRIYVNKTLFSIDFKTTRNVEKNSHDMYFSLVHGGELVAIVYNDRPSEKLPDGEIKAAWITNLQWTGPFPPSQYSRSGDSYYKIGGGIPLVDFLKSVKPRENRLFGMVVELLKLK